MKTLRGMALLVGFLAVGEALARVFPFPLPGNVIGLLLLTLGLVSGIVKLAWVEETADFLTKNLAFFFIPAGVGLLAYFDVLGKYWPAILTASVLGTALTAVGVGIFHKALSRRSRKHG